MKINLRKHRKEKGMSIEQLARLSSVSVGTISRIENKEVDPKIMQLVKLCYALSVEINELVDIHVDI